MVALGISVRATRRDASKEKHTVKAISVKICFTSPSIKTMGRKTTTVVSVEATMAPPICLAPCKDAAKLLLPCNRSLWMFSSTIMELSTSIPTPSTSPHIEIRFSVIPAKYINTKVTTTENTMDMETVNVGLMRSRNTNNTTAASNAP